MRPGFAAFLELCCGPLYILAKVQLADGVVAVAEAAAITAKGGLTLFLLTGSSLPVPIALSWAQVVSNQHVFLCAASACWVCCCLLCDRLTSWAIPSLHLWYIFSLHT